MPPSPLGVQNVSSFSFHRSSRPKSKCSQQCLFSLCHSRSWAIGMVWWCPPPGDVTAPASTGGAATSVVAWAGAGAGAGDDAALTLRNTASAGAATLTLPAAEWSTGHVVCVRANRDGVDEGDNDAPQLSLVTATVRDDGTADPAYAPSQAAFNAVLEDTVALATTDVDVAGVDSYSTLTTFFR